MASGTGALKRGLAAAAVLGPLVLGGIPAAADPPVPPPGAFATGSSTTGSGGFASGSGIVASGSGNPGPRDNALRLGPIAVHTSPPRMPQVEAAPVPAPPAREVAAPDASWAHTLGLNSGSVGTACAGSAVAGGSGILLGLLTGSGLVGPGTVGVGSSGSSLGSVAVGSALTGSALLTCLLLLPGIPPPAPGLPLRIPMPIPPIAPVRMPAPLRPPPPAIMPAPSRVVPESEPIAESSPPAAPVAWNVLELVTVLVVSVIAAYRGRTSGGGQRARA
ncbi:hypothetical protein KO481_19735 [Nocardia sp. NEAU-G5]|uniref:Uncharacterized protein n=1 Tax=Nocardia albiluteola TaxID=2842303 RepID=A0ABS6B0D0_9NOCA|nr:hypothetical protein [Nocardia albiluteola]MBU3063753.1 hypothetical protein [Nocardia albiluteola]